MSVFLCQKSLQKRIAGPTWISLTSAWFSHRNILTLTPTSDRLTPCETGLIEKSGLRKHGGFDILVILDAN